MLLGPRLHLQIIKLSRVLYQCRRQSVEGGIKDLSQRWTDCWKEHICIISNSSELSLSLSLSLRSLNKLRCIINPYTITLQKRTLTYANKIDPFNLLCP